MDDPPEPPAKPKRYTKYTPVTELRPRKETATKRETRSRHEKKRREEFNDVLAEMMSLLPDNIEVKYKKVDRQPRQPDKCFIIGNAVHMIKNSDYRPGLLYDNLTHDVFELANSFMIFMNNFVITGIEGEHGTIFDLEKEKMLGKDIRCFLDFQSASKLSFLDPTLLFNQLQMNSFLAKSMTCKFVSSPENPSESILVCVPDQLNQIERPQPPPPRIPAPPTYLQMTPPKSPPPSKMEVERPILAALLRKKPINPPTIMADLDIPGAPSTSTATASTFMSPTSSSCSTVPRNPPPPPPPKATPARRVAKPLVHKVRKRIRSQNVIVEHFPLPGMEDEDEKPPPKKPRKRQSAPAPPPPSSTPAPTTVIAPTPIVPIPISVASTRTNIMPPSQSVIQPVPTQNTYGMNPFDVLAPNYRHIWLRLQSERLLLEERISAKQGELTNLMQITQQPPPNFLNLPPQYFVAPQSSNL